MVGGFQDTNAVPINLSNAVQVSGREIKNSFFNYTRIHCITLGLPFNDTQKALVEVFMVGNASISYV